MTTTYTLTLNQNNDETVQLTLTNADPGDSGTPYIVPVGGDVQFFCKTSQTTPDSDAATIKLTLLGGQITAINAAAGIYQAAVTAADIAIAGAKWWRCDVVGNGGAPRKTAGYGDLNITAV
jgi:hypothetical protein